MSGPGNKARQPLWLVANTASGSTSQQAMQAVESQLTASGRDVRIIDIGGRLPPLPEHDDQRPATIASLGGDGTARAVIDRYGTSAVPLLVLPGGTMNLLARRLHGDADVATIIGRWTKQAVENHISLPQIEGDGIESLVGIIAGPTTAWGEGREHLRHWRLGMALRSAARALQALKHEPNVRVAGVPGSFQALFVCPCDDGLEVHRIDTDSVTALLRHGVAWMMRQFLGGPTERIACLRTVTLHSARGRRVGRIRMLVDGERANASSPLTLKVGMCPARFITTTAQVGNGSVMSEQDAA